MDRASLNQKTWYRALKVIFVVAFILFQAGGFGIVYSIASQQKSFVNCDNGKTFENPYFYADDQDKKELFKKCDIDAYFFNKSEVKGFLPEYRRQELDGIVFEMQNRNALESEIQTTVDDFKVKYTEPNPDAGKKYTPEELSKEWGHDISDTFKVGNGYWVPNFKFVDKDQYSIFIKISFFILSFVVVSFVFWLIKRVFFYIFIKEKFLRL